jgi:VWFA-related protein
MIRKIRPLGMALLLCVPAVAQTQATQPPAAGGAPAPTARNQNQQAPAIQTQVTAVIVPVTVKDREGRLVGDLTKDDLRILCDGVQQKILLFTADPFPLSAVVVIDNDLAQKQAALVQKSLTTISAGFGPEDEVALVTYEEFPTTVADFSKNNDDLFTRLKRLEIGSHNSTVVADPTTAGPVINGKPAPSGLGLPIHGSGRYKTFNDLDDAIYSAGDMLKTRGRSRRKIVFLVSDGSDSRNNQHTFDETLRALLSADVSVYAISVGRSVPLPVGKSLLEHGVAEVDKFADRTGGDTFSANKQEDLERLYSDVTEEARNQYTITFQPSGTDRSHDYHEIEVRVLRPSLNVIARRGYYESANSVGH